MFSNLPHVLEDMSPYIHIMEESERAELARKTRNGAKENKDGFNKMATPVDTGTPKPVQVYIGGALANAEIVRITALLQKVPGVVPFSEWYTPGAEADVKWRDYELALGHDYRTALRRPAAQNTFAFDKRHIDASEVFVMVLPCGKSAHMELGYAIGKGKKGIIYMPSEPDRWDVMYGFADAVVMTDDELISEVLNVR